MIVFLPCRKGSQRVVNKNTRPFCDIEGGLTEIKINQLIATPSIDKIIVSTDDDKVKKICYEKLHQSHKEYEILDRPENLAASTTSTDDVIKYVSEIMPNEDVSIMWTHVTSPFIDESIYEQAIQEYRLNRSNFDSLMSVTKIQKYLWDTTGKAINYDRSVEKWPPTQELPELYEINSGIFIADLNIYQEFQDRVGVKPYLFKMDEYNARDIDWEEDFKVAELQWQNAKKQMTGIEV
ncbi:acylneuraminate cytidylyltransferase family protein [Priestia flexa]|uniref:acylneuraminate cytidylyltransferase family protein n=1 Tax=Priestia flexa TaxID=86664 RepID=UPI001CD45AFC|nr:acylneuraminate cytidylyltransferase family protein [Priestia flexa]MCA1202282.1 acylneuraminate cytidylyltransferase family protein [Priestia flexa]